MSIFSRLFQKASKTGYSLFLQNKSAQWSPQSYESFSKEAYKKNIIAFQAINKKAKAIAQIPWTIQTKDGAEVGGGPMFDAINQPNNKQSLREFLEATVGYYCLSGNTYWERTNVGRNVAPEFYTLRPDKMTIKLNEFGEYASFKYEHFDRPIYWQGDEVNLVRHIKTFNPLDEVYGMSPIEAAAYSIDQHNESSEWLQALLQNGASPSGALMSDDTLSEDDFNQLKTQLEDRYSGGKNAGRPILLQGGIKWQQMGMSPQNMSILDSKFSSARDIALAFEVPPLLLSIQGDSTYSNYKEARLAFYEETVIPLAEQLVDEFNQWNEDRLNGAKICLDLDSVPAIIEKRQMFWDMANNSNDLTINEKREMKGYPPVENGDTVYISGSDIPLSFDSDLDLDENSDDDAYGES